MVRNQASMIDRVTHLSAGADTKANTLGAGSALELGDLGLLEDGGERGGALCSDVVVAETANAGGMVMVRE